MLLCVCVHVYYAYLCSCVFVCVCVCVCVCVSVCMSVCVCVILYPILFYRYKCPFLKGSIDVLIDKHSKIEELMAKDLENWLGNLYFEVIRMPR